MRILVRSVLVLLVGVQSGRLRAEVPEEALRLARQGKLAEASTLLQAELKKTPEDKRVRYMLAQVHAANGEPAAAITVLEGGLKGQREDLPLLWLLGETHRGLGEDGPNVTRKGGMISVKPSGDKEKEEAFKKEHLRLAAEAYGKAVKLAPSYPQFSERLVAVLSDLGETDEAIGIMRTLVERNPLVPTFRTKLAELYIAQGKREEAVECLEAVLKEQPTSAAAHAALAECYGKVAETELAAKHGRMAEFYEWVPDFARIPYSDANYRIFSVLALGARQDDEEAGKEEAASKLRRKTIGNLLRDGSAESLGFLAALCLAHTDHGEIEDRAFQALASNQENGVPLLLELLQNGTSVCTIRQSAEALARLKVKQAFEPLVERLPGDVRPVWTANIAEALAVLGDDRAVVPLLEAADLTHKGEPSDDEDAFVSGGRLAARVRAVVALGAFPAQRAQIMPELRKGLANPELAGACHAALYRLTGERSHLELVRKSLGDLGESRPAGLLLMALATCQHPELRAVGTSEMKQAEKAMGEKE